ncbi:MAG: LysM peptidoglycan-binding domain-containing protein [Caldilinea sp.]|nr:LysM peptidoglycan-binding domain-containing protein [Caldilinea sp.]MDW8442538.1 LysM peptidoglycan-binding domain-containing protein [Caldilineaceae bacterium]
MHPAPSRLLAWGAPLALVALFGAAFWVQLGNAGPAHWVQRQMDRTVAFVAAIGEQLQPDLTITLGASAEGEEDELLGSPQATTLSDASAQPEEGVASHGDVENTPTMIVSAEDTVLEGDAPTPAEAESLPAGEQAPPETPAEAPTATPTDEPTPTATPTSTSEPTPTSTSEPTPMAASANSTLIGPATPTFALTMTPTFRAGGEPTSQPLVTVSAATTTVTATNASALTLLLPTPTPPPPTPTPKIHIIRAGDTLFEIAMANDVSLSALLAANGLTENDVYTIQPGDEIVIPDPSAPVEASPTPTPTPLQGNFTYTVQPGDTLMAIGMRFGVNLQRILEANNLTLAQARTLRPGQQLIIPGDVTPSSPTPTVAVTPSPTPTSAASAFRLDAPVLRTPENQVSVKCGVGEQLVWNPVAAIQPTDLYLVHLGYVNGRDAAGVEQIVWVIQQQRPANVTLWRLDDTLCGLAPLEFGRQWRWYVQVVVRGADGALTPVSPPSEIWGFTWQ